jgi:hypothetical protein
MKKLAAAVLTALAFASPLAMANAPAAAPSAVDQRTVAAVKDMLESMKYRDTMKALMTELTAQLPQMLQQSVEQELDRQNLSDAQRKEVMALIQQKMPELVETVRQSLEDPKLIEEILDRMPALYARYFTTAEIVELARFYKTPLGAKTMQVLPQLTAESMQIGQQVVAPRVQALQQRVMQVMQNGATPAK